MTLDYEDKYGWYVAFVNIIKNGHGITRLTDQYEYGGILLGYRYTYVDYFYIRNSSHRINISEWAFERNLDPYDLSNEDFLVLLFELESK